MIPQAFITAWRAKVPWSDDAQIEQDLVLSRALVMLFASETIRSALALRGGTALNKLYLPTSARYSEDIDLVQIDAASIGPVIDTIRSILDPWLGEPKRSTSRGNMTLVYRFESEVPPVRPLRLKVETNTREHFTVLGFAGMRFAVENPWFVGDANVTTYQISELLGTKLRALYQRRKGRDLFDLWLCNQNGLLNAADAVKCFMRYMQAEGRFISRAEFEMNLHDKSRDTEFLSDIGPLLASHVKFDASVALQEVRKAVIERLPGEAWAGANVT